MDASSVQESREVEPSVALKELERIASGQEMLPAPPRDSLDPPPHEERRSSLGTPGAQTHVFIVRHAEHVSPDSSMLSPSGSLQASALAETFRKQAPFRAIFTSPRAVETAQIIAAALGLSVVVDDRLKNWDGGVTVGLSRQQVREQLPEVYEQRFVLRAPTYRVPEGESLQQRYDRVSAFLGEIVSKYEKSQVIIVTHGGIIDDMFRIACSVPLPQVTGLMKPYGCVSVLVYVDGKWQEKQWARADHLPRVVAESPSGGHLYLFPHQVSGSFPLLRGDRGELCKPATARELGFYEALFAPSAPPEVQALSQYVPKFFGTSSVALENLMALKPHVDGAAPPHRRSFSVSALWAAFASERHKKMIQTDDGRLVYLILENLTHGITRPHILDVKMGTRTHRDGEPEDKKARKADKAAASTSLSLGVRVQGLHVYDKQGKLHVRDKYALRNINEAGFRDCLQTFVAGTCDAASAVEQLEALLAAVRQVNWRFYGSSVLLVFDSLCEGAKPTVRLIDFGSCEFSGGSESPGPDKGLVLGLQSLVHFFSDLRNAA